jgi:hypothetical protein
MSETTANGTDELDSKTWMQLRQCTYLALHYLRRIADDDLGSRRIVAEMERILAEGSTDPVT